MEYVTFNNKNKIPIIGLGTWKSPSEKVKNAVIHALKTGYTHIDCAAAYQNEDKIGEAFEHYFTKMGGKRENIFVTSKLWNTCHSKDHVEKACRQTLKDLKLDYLDLYLIHWPYAFENNGLDIKSLPTIFPIDKTTKKIKFDTKSTIKETWLEMEKLVEKGLVKNIGISNFSIEMIHDMSKYWKIKPVLNQVEIHPFSSKEDFRKPNNYFGIDIQAYSPLGSGANDGPLFNKTIKQIAEKYKKTVAQVIIRWFIQRKICVLPKSVTPSRIEENFNVFDFKLSDQDMKEINNLSNTNHKDFLNPYWMFGTFE